MGEKVTMKDIAVKLDLSINAVSLVLNNKAGVGDDTRKLILEAASSMGYFDNKPQYLRTYASKNICLLLEERFFRDPYFYSKVILGIEEEARKNGFDIIVNFIDNTYAIPSCLVGRRAAGLIAVGPMSEDYILKLKSFKLPMVLVDNLSLDEGIDNITTDNKSGGYKATRYLIHKGFRKIGFFGDLEYSFSIKERYFGFSEAIKKIILPGESIEDYVERYSITSNLEKLVIKNNMKEIVERLKTLKEWPGAFVCSNDNAAILLCNALNMLGYKVPEDISVIGFDDIALCSMVFPKLTTIRVNKEAMGRKAFQKLIWRMRHLQDQAEGVVMSVELIERDSVRNLNIKKVDSL